MEKPPWRRRSSTYVVDSPHMRVRRDEIELPDGTIVTDYFVRESHGFVVVFPLTADDRVVMVRQYRYGADAIALELPAGVIDPGEDLLACAARELAEETGYEAGSLVELTPYYPEASRSTARGHIFVAHDVRRTREPSLDPTEVLEVELVSLADFRRLLAGGTIDSAASIVAGYRALDFLNTLSLDGP
ncbi:MAG TPA: NUDIX hydrolase [Verrucomicrobiae bacterium]|nr:NUDIX hydrolase [Verrucomicrobiae bacterium]